MTESEANRVADNWLGFATKVSYGVPRPATISREDWQAEAFVGLADGLRRYVPRPGRIDAPGSPAGFLKRAIRSRLRGVRLRALRQSGAVIDRADNIELPLGRLVSPLSLDLPMNFEDGDGGSLHDAVGDPASPDPLGEAIAAETMETLREACKSLTRRESEALAYMLADRTATEFAADHGLTPQAGSFHFRNARAKLSEVLS